MEWSTLAPTALGGALAIVGGLVGAWWSERGAAAREERARLHERDVWARERRFEAHTAFVNEFERLWHIAQDSDLRK